MFQIWGRVGSALARIRNDWDSLVIYTPFTPIKQVYYKHALLKQVFCET